MRIRVRNVIRHKALSSVAAIMVVGCAAAGTTDLAPDAPDAPAEWSARDDISAPPRGDWLNAFDDAALRGLVVEAIENNYDLAAAAARFEQAEASAVAAGAPRLPSVDLNMSGSQTESVIDGATPTDVTTNATSLALSASWELDLWRRLANQAEAGDLDALASEADLADARLSLAGSIARAWYDLIEARLLFELAADDVATQERSLNLTQRRFSAGVSTALDVRLARSSLATAQAQLANRENLLNVFARRLEALLGRYPAAELATSAPLPSLEPLDGAGAPGDLLARRPDLRAAEARLYSAGLRADAARAALLPRLTLSGSAGAGGDAIGEMFDPDYLATQIAASLLQPIFRGGALRAEARRAEAAAQERVANYASLALSAYEEAENAIDADASLALQEASFEAAADEAVAAEALAEREYTRGVGTIFDLLNAQSRRISAQRSLINTRAQRLDNRIQLYIAIGGDFLVGYEPSSDAMTVRPPGE